MIRVCLVDDQTLVRQGIRSLLALDDGIEVVAEAADGRQAVELIPQIRPDVVLMDMRMPVMSGLEALQVLSRQEQLPPTIILTTFDDDQLVLAGLKAGAKGYLLKDSIDNDLLRAVRAVAQGDGFLSPEISSTVLSDYQQVADPFDQLTAREREVLQMLAEGKVAKEIATALDISIYTVDAHRGRIMKKLTLHSSTEIVRYAMRKGLIQ